MKRAIREELETIRSHFRAAGCRWTRQRQTIVEEALLTHDHFTAEELLAMVRRRVPGSTVHLATIYRTLQVLEDGRFIEGLDVGRGGRRFEHVVGHEHHDHVICVDCGRICEFHDHAMERRKALAAKRLGFTIRGHALRIHGTCDKLARDGTCEFRDLADGGDCASVKGSVD